MLYDSITRMAATDPKNRGIKVPDPSWEMAVEIARQLGCLAPDGTASVGRMVAEIGDGTLSVRRAKPTKRPLSMAARIREQIDLDPAATDRDIARRLGAEVMQVCQERGRYARKRADAAGA